VGLDGAVTQLLSFDIIGWHAGVSSWDGREAFNQYSLGIEIDNAGQLEERDGRYLSWFGQEYPAEEVVHAIHRNQQEATYWQTYTPGQLEVVEELARLLVSTYGLRYILGHEEIAPDRKVDPGPAYPLEELRHKLLSGNE
jgi:N-acetylmuramoyl-L-alanine amidase